MDETASRMRIDKWLWAARFFKTRSLAAQAVDGGKVKLRGERVKPAKELQVGDRLDLRIGPDEWQITVRVLSERRGPASAARELYAEDETSRERRTAAVAARRAGVDPSSEHGGRPDKRQRRILQRLRGY
jgi:ribosome-associated heat shock protein Hsp15